MSIKVCVIASGSTGNCIYIGSEGTSILIDAGISCKETTARLASIGVELAQIEGVCVSHEHSDHTSSLGVLHRKTGVTPYANSGTIEAIEQAGKLGELPWTVFATGSTFEIGDLEIDPFSVPHDSYDPVGFIVKHGKVSVGVITDMGMVTGLIRERLKHCSCIIVESNHDEQMLQESSRPWSLKQRIAGRQGHLSNEGAASLISEIALDQLSVVFLAHQSADCNEPDLALSTMEKALQAKGRGDVRIEMTWPDRPSRMIELS